MRRNGISSSPDESRSQFIQHIVTHPGSRPLIRPRLIGALEGEGIGPEVVCSALDVLRAVSEVSGSQFSVERGGPIGKQSESECGTALSDDVIDFCAGIFARDGAILAGAGGSRFVYDLRKRFDLFCKVVPIRSERVIRSSGPIQSQRASSADFVLIRENTGGIYQGRWTTVDGPSGKTATHAFEYTESHVTRIVEVGARIARTRNRKITVVWKESGIPSVSRLWRDCTEEISGRHGIEWEMIDVDYAAYALLVESDRFDVVVAPNLFGDILGDLCAVISGSRGLAFSGNYDVNGNAVYQTNHGAAFDLAGTDRANPVGQILSLAMMLRESFGLADEADLIEGSIREVWADGWRTFDLAENGCRVVGTRRMAELIAERILESELRVSKP